MPRKNVTYCMRWSEMCNVITLLLQHLCCVWLGRMKWNQWNKREIVVGGNTWQKKKTRCKISLMRNVNKFGGVENGAFLSKLGTMSSSSSC